MMTNLAIFSYPSTIVWVDDDSLFLRAITRSVCNGNEARKFNDAFACLAFFENYQPVLSSSMFLRGCLESEDYDSSEHMPVDLNAEAFATLRHHEKRMDDVSVMVVDYNMPNIKGLELCRRLKDVPIKKILLTGEVNHAEAVSAFNEGLIDRFIRKDDPDLVEKLKTYIASLSQQYFVHHTKWLLSHLETGSALPISDPLFATFFKNWCDENHIQEYYMVDKQGNFMVVNDKQERFYFAIHTDRTLSTFIDLHKDEESVVDFIQLVEDRKLIPFFGPGRESWQEDESLWPSKFYVPGMVEGKEKYYWAIIEEGDVGG